MGLLEREEERQTIQAITGLDRADVRLIHVFATRAARDQRRPVGDVVGDVCRAFQLGKVEPEAMVRVLRA